MSREVNTDNANAAPGDGLDRLLSVRKVCEILSTTDRSLRRWVHLGLIPKPDVRIGRNLRWRASTIAAIVNGDGVPQR